MLTETFYLTKKPAYLIQKLFMMEAALYSNYKITLTIAGSSFLLSYTIEVFANIVKGFQLLIIITKSSILDVGGNPDPTLITIFANFSVGASNTHLIQFNCNLWKQLSLYFIKGSTVQIPRQRLPNIELSGTKIAGFQSKAIATKSSTLDILGVPDLPLTKVFGKVIFNLTQATVMPFNLIVI